MPAPLVAVASLLLGSAFLLIAGGLHGILLPVRGSELGFSLGELGLLGTGWSAGFIAGCFLTPYFVSRVGHVRTYGALASVAGITILLNLLIVTPWAWIIIRAANGLCFAGAAMVVESWLNEKATSENRGTIFSIYQMVNFGASTTGQLLLVINPPNDYFFFAIGAIFYCLAILPTALSTARSPQPLKSTRLDVRRLYEISPVGAVVAFMVGLVNGGFGTLGPVFGQQIGLAVRDISFMMAGSLIGGSLIQFPLGWLSDRTDRRRVLIGVSVVALAIGLVFATFHPHSPLVVPVLAIIFGASAYPMYALTVAHANDFASSDEFVKIASSLLLIYGIGTMIGPLAAAYAMGSLGPEGLFVFTAIVHVVVIGYVAYRITRRPTLNRVLRDPFQATTVMKTATPEGTALDPRAADPGLVPAEAAASEHKE
jgi:MFS family permease